ncbi:MFS transporter [Caballeronia sp. 15715]|jgi:MFS family permease|uniref:MFS transporter n=1 Tax=unclassified Caballeronia TaxID=2646786 RepID=UPI0039E2A0E4
MKWKSEKDGTKAKSHDAAYEWKVLILMGLGFGLVGFDRWLIAPLFPSIMRDLNLNYQQLGNLFGILSFTWGLWAILAGPVSDRIGRRKILTVTLIVFSLFSCLSGLVTGFASLMAMRALMGVAEGAFTPVSIAAVGEASLPSRRGLNQGLQMGMFSVCGLGLAPIVATQLLRAVSWHWVFLISAVPGFVVALLTWLTLRPDSISAPAHAANQRTDVRWTQIFRSRNVCLGGIAILGAMAGMFILSAMVPSYLAGVLHIETQRMGWIVSATGFGGLLGLFTMVLPSDYIGRRPVAIYGFVASSVLLFLFTRVGADQPWLLFWLLFAISAFALPLISLLCGPIATEAAPPGLVASSVGFVVGIGEIFGGGLAPVIGGAIAQHQGLRATLYFASGMLMLGAVASIFLLETAPRRRGRSAAASVGAVRTTS